MNKTKIEWTDTTWNPVRGCTRVSEGCRNCYAETVAHRFSGPGMPYEGLVRIGVDGERRPEWNGKVEFVEKHLSDPMKWHDPRRIFVNSMSDLFHPAVKDEWIGAIFGIAAICQQHTFQILTKRPERMRNFVNALPAWIDGKRPLPNVWLGVSVEDQATADARIPLLLKTEASVRFISAEPMLGPISLEELPSESGIGRHLNSLTSAGAFGADVFGWLDWVICGGESGIDARPMKEEWALSLQDQCVAYGVPFFFKQWGEWLPAMCDGAVIDGAQALNASDQPVRVGKKRAGRQLLGRTWDEFPTVRLS